MVKAVQAEDSIAEYFDGLLKSRTPAEVGLLVGKSGVGSRDIALAVVPTPTQDGEQVLTISTGPASAAKPKKAGAAKAKSNEPTVSIELESDCIAEHALQVSRMLPGGISVLGLYIFAPESGYNSCSNQLCSTLASIAADSSNSSSIASSAAAASALTGAATASAAGNGAPAELLLLHVDSTSRKFTLRSCQVSSGGTLKMCELKFGSSLSSLVPLRCSHQFDIAVPAAAAAAGGSALHMQQVLQDIVALEAARVQSAVAAVAGQIPTSSTQPIGDFLASMNNSNSSSNASSDAAGPTVVELYCLPHAAAALQPTSTSHSSFANNTCTSSSSVSGSCRLHGTVQALAYVHKRDPVSKAVTELKNDIICSLAARLQLLADEALAASADADEGAGSATAAAAGAAGDAHQAVAAAAAAEPAHSLLVSVDAGRGVKIGLARRVLVPWAGLNLQVCDYLSEGETPEHTVDRAQQLMQLDNIPVSAVVELESPAAQKPTVVAGTAVQAGSSNSSGGSGLSCTGPVMAAAVAGLVAAVSVGIAYVNLG